MDVALRYGSPDDASLYGFKICDAPGFLVAVPDYLERHGTPEHPHDLASHNGLFYQLYDLIHDVWPFTQGTSEFNASNKINRLTEKKLADDSILS